MEQEVPCFLRYNTIRALEVLVWVGLQAGVLEGQLPHSQVCTFCFHKTVIKICSLFTTLC